MYLGRIVAVGMTQNGQSVAMYRVSSRSFPNRETKLNEKSVSVIPKAGFESDLSKNPYIAYNCIQLPNQYAVVSNGSHTDPIAEKIAMGMPVRDAISLGLLAMDYEKDSLDTPRIVGVINLHGNEAFLGIVRKDALLVRKMQLTPGSAFFISTYEKNMPADNNIDHNFDVSDAQCACDYVISGGVFANFTNPVAAASALSDGKKFTLGAKTL